VTALPGPGGARLADCPDVDPGATPGMARQGLVRLLVLYMSSRRMPVALAAVVALAGGLRIAAIWHWDTYGALQLPLVVETACATVVAAATVSPFGGQERASGHWLPMLRLAAALGLTTWAVIALAAAGAGAHLSGGFLDMTRNVAGIAGLALLGATALGGGLAWAGPVGYLVVAAYSLYAQWHGGGPSTPWIWPARPLADAGAWLCAGAVFAAGMTLIAVRGARDGT
jgi:hypothetical protein